MNPIGTEVGSLFSVWNQRFVRSRAKMLNQCDGHFTQV